MTSAVRKLIWGAAIVWSLLAWAIYAATKWVGGSLARHADLMSSDPQFVETLWSAMTALTKLGLIGIGFIWALGLIAISIVALVLRVILGREAQVPSGPAAPQILPPERARLP